MIFLIKDGGGGEREGDYMYACFLSRKKRAL
jgi:hypothetical protein